MKYQSELIKEMVDSRGHEKSSIHYQSECIETWIEEAKGAYPKLCDYESEWLNYIVQNPIGRFPYENVSTNTTETVNHVVPYAYKSATLKGSTKYRDIDTGDILDTFDETKNLELVSVKMPVLTTSNGDGTKTNILTVNEDVELRGIGDVQDTLNLMTAELTERIGEVVLDGSEVWGLATTKEKTQVFELGLSVNQKLNNAKPNGLIMCDKFKVTSGVDDEIIILMTSLYLGLLKSKASTVEELKVYLSQNPITIQYQTKKESVKTVDLSITDQDDNTLSTIKPIEGTMHIEVSGEPIAPTAVLEIPVEAITQNLQSFIEEE